MAWIKGMAPLFMKDKAPLVMGQKIGRDVSWHWEMDKCWEDFDRGYNVTSRMVYTKQFGNIEHASISIHNGNINSTDYTISIGGMNIISWEEKMMIKNELFGEDRFAIEIYPKQDKLIDVADVYHIWIFNKKYDMPFGIHPKEYDKAEPDKIWENFYGYYNITSRTIPTKKYGNIDHVIISTDGKTVSWAEKMRIKNELFGEDRFAIEIYPKQDRVVDTSDYHIWVFEKKYDMPFGIHPTEYKKAINRGATFYQEDFDTLVKTMEEHGYKF